MEPRRPRTEWGDRLLAWGMTLTVLIIALLGLVLLASVPHPAVGVSASVFAAAPGAKPTLTSPRLDSPLPLVELTVQPAEPAVVGGRRGAHADSASSTDAARRNPPAAGSTRNMSPPGDGRRPE